MKSKLIILLFISLFLVTAGYAQTKKKNKKIILKGLVLDTLKNPVENASVFIDGKNARVLTDAEGKFDLKVKPDVKTITVFTIAQGATEFDYNGEKEITIVVASARQVQGDPLNEGEKKESDLVNTGYLKAHKRNINTSIGEVNKNTIKNADHYRNIYDMIRGEVAGVEVHGNSIIIRGLASMTQSNEPLYIVNGMPVSSIDYISPSQVKSISVLKGSSAAIYGMRGANGVIVITLKTVND